MTIVNIWFVAIALSIDVFAVSMSVGAYLKKINCRQTFRLSWHFGFFQSMMTFIGWSIGITIKTYIQQFDHWIAFFFINLHWN